MKFALTVLVVGLAFVLGGITDKYLVKNPTLVYQWMPIKLVDADIARLLVLQERGGTYTRLASPSGAWGITAVRQRGGIWIIPCEEVSKKIGGYGK